MNRTAVILLVVAAALTGCEATTANHQYAGVECQQLGSGASPATHPGCAPIWGAQSSESNSSPR